MQRKIHYAKMMKTHQLGGNTRKESRCANCHDDYQNGIYCQQMLESVNGCSANLQRFSNWSQNPSVKEAIENLLETGIEQLGLKLRGKMGAKAGAEEGKEKDGSKAGEGDEEADYAEGEGNSTSTVESVWEILQSGGHLVLEPMTGAEVAAAAA